jgi:hypothetical protein
MTLFILVYLHERFVRQIIGVKLCGIRGIVPPLEKILFRHTKHFLGKIVLPFTWNSAAPLIQIVLDSIVSSTILQIGLKLQHSIQFESECHNINMKRPILVSEHLVCSKSVNAYYNGIHGTYLPIALISINRNTGCSIS